jgi:hypothetical protein
VNLSRCKKSEQGDLPIPEFPERKAEPDL